MDTDTKIIEILETAAKKINDLRATIDKQTNSYDFEKLFKAEMLGLERALYQEIVGE
jgi:hypothetical protein